MAHKLGGFLVKMVSTLLLRDIAMLRSVAALVVSLVISGCGSAQGFLESQRLETCGQPYDAPAKALPACTALIEASGSDAEVLAYAYFNRGVANHVSGKRSLALADLARAMEQDPDGFEPYAVRGLIHGEQGDLIAAQRDFAQALKRNPEDAATHANMAVTYTRQDDIRNGLVSYQRALALQPNLGNALGGRCWCRAALGLELQEALADCDEALRQNPEDYNTFNSRGLVKFRLGDHAGAIADYDKAIAGDPSVGSSYYVRGLAKRALGRNDEAAADIAEGIKRQANVAERYAGFGVAAPTL